jgi:hypothetical protein
MNSPNGTSSGRADHPPKVLRPSSAAAVVTTLGIALACVMTALTVHIFYGCQLPHAAHQRSAVRVVLRNTTYDDKLMHNTGKPNEHAAATAGLPAVDHQKPLFHSSTDLVTSHVHFHLPAQLGLPSDVWRPHIYSRCVAGMPSGYAPCLNYSNLLRGDELVYPGEQLPVPTLNRTELT